MCIIHIYIQTNVYQAIRRLWEQPVHHLAAQTLTDRILDTHKVLLLEADDFTICPYLGNTQEGNESQWPPKGIIRKGNIKAPLSIYIYIYMCIYTHI